MSFQEIILLLTFIGSCIYATVSITLKVLEFLSKYKISLTFTVRLFCGAPSGTRTQDPLIKSQLLYQLS